MTDTNDPGQLANEAKTPEDEEIIDLTDVVENLPSEDEEIIDLTDIVEEPPPEVEEVAASAEVSEDTEAVAVSDDVAETPVEAEPDPLSDMALELPEETNDFEDLETTDDTFDEAELGIEVDEATVEDTVVLDENEELDEDLAMADEDDDDFVESMGMAIEPDVHEPIEDTREEAIDAEVSLTQGQVEEALERVIEKMFSEKIDNILVEVIEKLVSKEIDKLRDILLEKLTGDE